MRDDLGATPDSAAVPLKQRNRSRREQSGSRVDLQASPESATMVIPCINDAARDCVLCAEFDECSFVDRRSSLNSVAFSLVFSVIVAVAVVLWLLLY